MIQDGQMEPARHVLPRSLKSPTNQVYLLKRRAFLTRPEPAGRDPNILECCYSQAGPCWQNLPKESSSLSLTVAALHGSGFEASVFLCMLLQARGHFRVRVFGALYLLWPFCQIMGAWAIQTQLDRNEWEAAATACIKRFLQQE